MSYSKTFWIVLISGISGISLIFFGMLATLSELFQKCQNPCNDIPVLGLTLMIIGSIITAYILKLLWTDDKPEIQTKNNEVEKE